MRDRAVVALEIVLGADLPVGLVLGLRAAMDGERVQVEHRRPRSFSGHTRRGALPRGSTSGSGLTKTNGPHVSTSDTARERGRRSKPGSRQSAAPRAANRRARRSTRGTGTARLAPARALGDEVAAVPADVHERAQRPRSRPRTTTPPGAHPTRVPRRTHPGSREPGRPPRPAYCQKRTRRTVFSRAAATSASAYHRHGIERLPAVVAIDRMLLVLRRGVRLQPDTRVCVGGNPDARLTPGIRRSDRRPSPRTPRRTCHSPRGCG